MAVVRGSSVYVSGMNVFDFAVLQHADDVGDMDVGGRRVHQKRFLPWITKQPPRYARKPKWMSPRRGGSIFKRNQVIQDLLHNSATTEFICK